MADVSANVDVIAAFLDTFRASDIGGFQQDNLTDSIFAIARAVDRLAQAVETIAWQKKDPAS
jgi:hypothetical protein